MFVGNLGAPTMQVAVLGNSPCERLLDIKNSPLGSILGQNPSIQPFQDNGFSFFKIQSSDF